MIIIINATRIEPIYTIGDSLGWFEAWLFKWKFSLLQLESQFQSTNTCSVTLELTPLFTIITCTLKKGCKIRMEDVIK